MNSPSSNPATPPKSRSSAVVPGLLAIALPIALWYALPLVPAGPPLRVEPGNGSRYPASPLKWSVEAPTPNPNYAPWITNTQIIDWNGDGTQDLLVCDTRFQRVLGYTRGDDGKWTEHILGEELPCPAHATIVDLDRDGDLDVIVSILGSIWPSDENVGALVWLEKTADGYKRHDLLNETRRIADAQPGDFDGDGDIDLAVAVFGYCRGSIVWLENDGKQNFNLHTVMHGAGAIHIPVADFDGDGDLDFATGVTQDEEEVWLFTNDGKGHFKPSKIFDSLNFDLGSAGLVADDLDKDGDMDLILPVGDNLEDTFSYPQPYHGCFWLVNNGGGKFETKRIGTFGGTYAAAVGDLDGDGDRDVVLVSMFNDWDTPGNASVVWLENDGKQNFKTWQVAEKPTHLVTVGCGDLNRDGKDDFVTGALQLMSPFEHVPGVTLWLSSSEKTKP